MFERPRAGERAILVHVAVNADIEPRALAEFEELAASAGADVLAVITGSRRAPDARYFVGSGKAEEIRDRVAAEGAELVIFDHELSPSQERNLEALLQCRVLDRSGLILDIFAQRARSFEGKLQVELAQLEHMATRLVRGWTHLERQKGGIGLRGPGETQLETDRRLLAERIRQLKRRLAKVGRQRDQGRQSRRKADRPTVSLVGYTNAGKSTLFNALTGAEVYAADQLFATLDPTLRRLDLPNAEPVVIADTVGFIARLPHELVAAFRSTLEETIEASLLLHVIDAADPAREELAGEVERVLGEIGADAVPRLLVYNKIDLLEGAQARVDRDAGGRPLAVWASATTGAGLDALRGAIAELLRSDTLRGWLELGPEQARLRARLFDIGAVVNEQVNPDGHWRLEVSASRKHLRQLGQLEGLGEDWMKAAGS
ncbi:GTP-binding protein HflX [Plasticicumulans lactativorans]|uniref:GTPase HflX n=1 Tax=Plasticicumulans lactativorans TaxID=1133106 RepID=A0A4R2KRQ0_9GAMM|nr:ribosome rescue GTPase HflX [Plasticicumulans lactativorans]TCO76971.1 GTP-binding protein HflX [Plasticicumulans lactativorans]